MYLISVLYNMRVKSCNLTSVWNVQAAVVNECGVWVRNVATRWKVEVTDHVKCDSSVWLLCRRVRRLQSHKFFQGREIRRTVALATVTVKQGVNPSPVRRLSQSVPHAGGVQKFSHDDRPEDALQCLVVQPVRAQHTQCVLCLRTFCRQFRDVCRNCKVIRYGDAEHPQLVPALDSK